MPLQLQLIPNAKMPRLPYKVLIVHPGTKIGRNNSGFLLSKNSARPTRESRHNLLRPHRVI